MTTSSPVADGDPGARGQAEQADAPAGLRVWQLRALPAGVALLLAGNGLQATLVGVRAGLEGMSDGTIGLIMSAYFAGFAAGSVLTPRLIETVGHIRAYAALASIASAISLLFVIFVSPPVWIALRALHGASYAGLVIVVETWLNGATARHQRGRILAIYMVVFYAGWAASQPMLLLATPGGFILFCVVSVCLSLALVPVTLSRAGVPGVVSASRPTLAQLYRVSPFAVIGSALTGAAASAFIGMSSFQKNSALKASSCQPVAAMTRPMVSIMRSWTDPGSREGY